MAPCVCRAICSGTLGLCHQLSQRSALPLTVLTQHTRFRSPHLLPFDTPSLQSRGRSPCPVLRLRSQAGRAGTWPRNGGCVLPCRGRTWRRAGVCLQLEQTGLPDGLDEGERKGGRRVTARCVSPGASAGAIYEDGQTGEKPVCGIEAGIPRGPTPRLGTGGTGAGHVTSVWFAV